MKLIKELQDINEVDIWYQLGFRTFYFHDFYVNRTMEHQLNGSESGGAKGNSNISHPLICKFMSKISIGNADQSMMIFTFGALLGHDKSSHSAASTLINLTFRNVGDGPEYNNEV